MREDFNIYSSFNGKEYTVIVKDRNTGLMAEVTGTLKSDRLDLSFREKAIAKLESLVDAARTK